MPNSQDMFKQRIDGLKADLVRQGRRVQALMEASFEAIFACDPAAADRIAELDEAVDRVDVDLERAAVSLLTDATGEAAAMKPEHLRMVLTIVKINNELERVADLGVSIAEQVRTLAGCGSQLPATFRVMANSCVGVLRDVTSALDRLDPALAKVVLLSEEAIGQFKQALIRDVHQQISRGAMSLDFASGLHDVAGYCISVADHCTNIAEQVMYVASGKIVRHLHGKWEEVTLKA
ncbi:MAG: phosphate uptake regulator PhoU [Phycisphaeraceae bacterium]|nr:phosphate uptake regulator PhoU [Phycisphaeraceae bacterium]